MRLARVHFRSVMSRVTSSDNITVYFVTSRFGCCWYRRRRRYHHDYEQETEEVVVEEEGGGGEGAAVTECGKCVQDYRRGLAHTYEKTSRDERLN